MRTVYLDKSQEEVSRRPKNQDLNESYLSFAKYMILIFIRCMTGSTNTLTSESSWLEPTRYGAKGLGVVVRWPHCAIWDFFF